MIEIDKYDDNMDKKNIQNDPNPNDNPRDCNMHTVQLARFGCIPALL